MKVYEIREVTIPRDSKIIIDYDDFRKMRDAVRYARQIMRDHVAARTYMKDCGTIMNLDRKVDEWLTLYPEKED